MVSCEDLWGLINVDVAALVVLDDVVLDLVEVHVGGPTVDVDYCQKYVWGVDWQAVQFLL